MKNFKRAFALAAVFASVAAVTAADAGTSVRGYDNRVILSSSYQACTVDKHLVTIGGRISLPARNGKAIPASQLQQVKSLYESTFGAKLSNILEVFAGNSAASELQRIAGSRTMSEDLKDAVYNNAQATPLVNDLMAARDGFYRAASRAVRAIPAYDSAKAQYDAQLSRMGVSSGPSPECP